MGLLGVLQDYRSFHRSVTVADTVAFRAWLTHPLYTDPVTKGAKDKTIQSDPYKSLISFLAMFVDKIRFVRDPTEARQLVDPQQLIAGAFGGDMNVSSQGFSLLLCALTVNLTLVGTTLSLSTITNSILQNSRPSATSVGPFSLRIGRSSEARLERQNGT